MADTNFVDYEGEVNAEWLNEVNELVHTIFENPADKTAARTALDVYTTGVIDAALALKADDADLTSHTGDTTNPHSVTKTQVSLGSVTDDAQLKIASNLSDLESVATAQSNLSVYSQAEVDAKLIAPTMQVFTAGGTWTKPSNCRKVKVTVIGAGGGGGGSNYDNGIPYRWAGGGGGAGGTAIEFIDVSAISSETITIGTAGSGGAAGSRGSDGGDSSFGSHCSGVGGYGGGRNSSGNIGYGTGGYGGVATGGDINITGASGVSAAQDRGNPPDDQTGPMGGAGGSTQYGGGGVTGTAGSTSIGRDATGYGAGGGGAGHFGASTTEYAGGDGTGGIVIVEEFY